MSCNGQDVMAPVPVDEAPPAFDPGGKPAMHRLNSVEYNATT
jgi:hypothetical protein